MAYSFCLILAWTLVLLWTFIHRKAPTQDTCAHCQRSVTTRESAPPQLTTFRRQRAAHHTTIFLTVNTSAELFCCPATPFRSPQEPQPIAQPSVRGARILTARFGLRKGWREVFFVELHATGNWLGSTALVRCLTRVLHRPVALADAQPRNPCARRVRICTQCMLARDTALIGDQHRNTCAGGSIFHRNKDAHLDHLRLAGAC